MPITLLAFVYLTFTAVAHRLIPNTRARLWWLSLVSLTFIFYLDEASLFVVLGLTVVTYLFGRLLDKTRSKAVLVIGVVCVALTLVVFKYLGMLTAALSGLGELTTLWPAFEIEKLLLPLGLSYITFKHISYLADIQWSIVKPGRFDDFLCYSALFTTFLAGPIERFSHFQPQLPDTGGHIREDFSEGVKRIVFGLFKKLVIANWVGFAISKIEGGGDIGDGQQLAVLFLYSILLYADFSGYSDIAIGGARLFGLRIAENFNWPYLASNISQFWRRWHISLSDWIRDYLFFPLSSISRAAWWNILAVPVIAMAICGLWHGAALHFVLWGVWHGVGLSVYQSWNQRTRKSKRWKKIKKNTVYRYAMTVVTFCYVTLGWWWFR